MGCVSHGGESKVVSASVWQPRIARWKLASVVGVGSVLISGNGMFLQRRRWKVAK
jgi:hypothetical protein